MELFLGIDGGGTSTKAALIDRSGNVLGRGAGGPSNLYYTEPSILCQSMKDAINAAMGALGSSPSISSAVKYACVAMAGAGRPGDVQKATILLESVLSFCPFWIEEDSKAALTGSLAGKDGIVVIAGTGSNCLGMKSGKYKRAGGWGSLLGDEGSAYRIAVKALSAVLRAYDGRAPKTSLTESFLKELGLEVPDLILPKVHKMDRTDIASLAPIVFREAEKDQVARRILEEEAQELVLMVKAVKESLGFCEKDLPIALIGGCFKNQLYLSLFTALLAKSIPEAIIKPSTFPPSVGAAIMARDRFFNENGKDVTSICP